MGPTYGDSFPTLSHLLAGRVPNSSRTQLTLDPIESQLGTVQLGETNLFSERARTPHTNGSKLKKKRDKAGGNKHHYCPSERAINRRLSTAFLVSCFFRAAPATTGCPCVHARRIRKQAKVSGGRKVPSSYLLARPCGPFGTWLDFIKVQPSTQDIQSKPRSASISCKGIRQRHPRRACALFLR